MVSGAAAAATLASAAGAGAGAGTVELWTAGSAVSFATGTAGSAATVFGFTSPDFRPAMASPAPS